MLTNERLINLEKVGEYQIITWEKQFEENKQGIIVQDSLLSENIQVRSQECIDKKAWKHLSYPVEEMAKKIIACDFKGAAFRSLTFRLC